MITDERPFQLAVLGVAAVLLVVRTYYRLRAGGTAPGLTHSQEHAVLGNLLSKVVLPMASVLCLAWLSSPARVAELVVPIPAVLRWCGLGVACLGLAMLGWVHHTLDRSFSPVIEIHPGQQLITHGPYRWIAHPMYTAFLVIDSGLSLLSAYPPLAVLLFGLLIPVIVRRTPKEEAMLLAHFGETYRVYRAGVGKLLPRFRARA